MPTAGCVGWTGETGESLVMTELVTELTVLSVNIVCK